MDMPAPVGPVLRLARQLVAFALLVAFGRAHMNVAPAVLGGVHASEELVGEYP